MMNKPNYVKFEFELPEHILSEVLSIALRRKLPYQKILELATDAYIIKDKENRDKVGEG